MDTAAITGQRFWSKVATGRPMDCWPWLATYRSGGYGAFKVSGRLESAHRVAWTLVNGPIPNGLLVLHRCDNPPCANPRHLFLGTHLDNARDKIAKGRARYLGQPGEANYATRLTNEDVVEIRTRYAAGSTSQRKLAREFAVSRRSIEDIVHRRRWKHLA